MKISRNFELNPSSHLGEISKQYCGHASLTVHHNFFSIWKSSDQKDYFLNLLHPGTFCEILSLMHSPITEELSGQNLGHARLTVYGQNFLSDAKLGSIRKHFCIQSFRKNVQITFDHALLYNQKFVRCKNKESKEHFLKLWAQSIQP